jgi:hypothetical protein
MKAKFDEAPDTIADTVNTLIDDLNALLGTLDDMADVPLKTEVLMLDNVTAFTPDADYEPATKKYVDDTVSGVALGVIPDNSITDAKLYATGVKSNLSSHTSNTSNPHSVTYTQVGASASGHNHSGVYDPIGTGASEASSAVSTHNSAVAPHTGKFEPNGAVSTHDGATTPHSGKFEAAGAVSTHNGSGSAHSGVFASSSHNHDSAYEAKRTSSSKSSSYDMLSTDDTILASGTGTTIKLPNPTNSFKRYSVIRTGSSNVTISRYGSENINGSASNKTLTAQYEGYSFMSDGTDWTIVAVTVVA